MKCNKLVAMLLSIGMFTSMAYSAIGAELTISDKAINRTYFNYYAFSEGMARVVDNKFYKDNYGYINTNGDEIIPCIYGDATDFSQGLAAVANENNQYGYIDKTGKIIISYSYDNAQPFAEDMAFVATKNNKYFIDTTGKVKIDVSKYTTVSSFHSGLAAVERGGKQGFINKKGEEVIPCEYTSVLQFQNNIGFGIKNNIQYGLNPQGAVVFEVKYDFIFPFQDGMAKVQKGGKIGYINTKGEEVIPCQYSLRSLNFSEGLAYVENETMKGYIDAQGSLKINTQKYDFARYFSNGYAICERDGKIAFIDKNGVVSPLLYGSAVEFEDGYAIAQKDKKTYLLYNENSIDYKIQADDWAKKDIERANNLSLIPRELNGLYRQNITREEFCTLIIHITQKRADTTMETYLKEKNITVGKNDFKDTNNQDVLYATALGIVSGKGNHLFDPKGNITRQEAAVMLYRTIALDGKVEEHGTLTFADAQTIDVWAKKEVGTMVQLNIMAGVEVDRFAPNEFFTRQQAIITMLRLYLR